MSADEIDKLYQNYEILNSATDKTKVSVFYRLNKSFNSIIFHTLFQLKLKIFMD